MVFGSSSESELKGIGGFLIVLLSIVLISAIGVLSNLYDVIGMLFYEGYWALLTSPESEYYDEYWVIYFIVDVVGSLLLVVLFLFVIFFLIKRSCLFPRVAVAYFFLNIVVFVVEIFIVKLITNGSTFLDVEELFGDLLLNAIVIFLLAFVFVPYLFISKRVRNTFGKS